MATQWQQDNSKENLEILNEKKLAQETNEKKEQAKENFEKSKNFEYLTNILESTKKTEKIKTIIDTITANYESLTISTFKLEKTKEELANKYEFSESISIEELAVVDSVENKLWKNLENKDKLELIRLLSWIEIKEKKPENKTDKSKYSKEMLNHPNISAIEWFYLKWDISEKDFIDIISSNNFEKALKRNSKVEQLFENLEKNNSSIDFEKEYWKYIPDPIKESFIIKELEKNFIWPIELKEPNAKEYNLFVSLEKVLNKTLSENKYFYKPDTYYEAIDIIRKVPEKTETINDFFELKLRALWYVMELATHQNPWRIEEKNSKAWEQKKAVEKNQENLKIEKTTEKNNPIYEKIIKLIEKNEELWEENIKEQLKRVQYIKSLEEQDTNPVNNPYYNPQNPSEILSENHDKAA